jgi:hypothetical protein
MILVMPEVIARFLVGVLGEILVTSIGAALVGLYRALPRPLQTVIRISLYLLLFLLVGGTYSITFIACALLVAKAENAWLGIAAGLLGAFCFWELVSLIRKAFQMMSDVSQQ